MHLPSLVSLLLATAPLSSAVLTYRLQRQSNPSADQADAYARIESAMAAATSRYNRLTTRPSKSITVQYVPGVQTADGNFNGNIRFGSNRAYMNERTALHEISHTLGIGQTGQFDARCKANNWPSATRLLRSWDGQSAKINCGGGHIWPYGLNYDNEMSETNAVRHCLLVEAMLVDGLAS
ncbi:hypothetical protein QBC37DRAFT_457428 [Rhypophila decipiens]|uniref:Ricin B lectin n=1 Tax=Rhypophila decipiens TaxID=261697 RepID=A0AAN6XW83_9PEZI|nr:hypothetical protein QBC37DRAFT_457428 [Rhypophila decipiens]